MTLLALRRLALAGSGVTFLVIGLAAIVTPVQVASAYGLRLDHPESMNEFRAVFTGFWLGLALAMLSAARFPQERRLGDLCGAMIGLQALARILSFALDGVPNRHFVPVALLELGTAVLIFIGRPRST